MPDEFRSPPAWPNLRFLKLEARHRLAAGEFDTLHNAQLAIAREHGMPGWAGLKEVISGHPHSGSHALARVRWLRPAACRSRRSPRLLPRTVSS